MTTFPYTVPAPYTDASNFSGHARDCLPHGYWAAENERRMSWRYGDRRDAEAEAMDLWLWNRFGEGYKTAMRGANDD